MPRRLRSGPSRERLRGTAARLAVLLVVLGLLTPAAVAAVTPQDRATAGSVELQAGTIQREAAGATVVSVQGFHFRGEGMAKKPARLVGVAPNGTTQWVFNGSGPGARWFYDVDPLANGRLLITVTDPTGTTVGAFDPRRQEIVWRERFDLRDTHDVTMLPNGDLLVAAMREYDAERGVSNDRLFVYNRSTGEVTWEWLFREHYPNTTDGGFAEDWTHVNDVDVIDRHRVLVSPRNFDQAIVLNRTTGRIEQRLGRDGNHDVLFEQHNPDYLVSEDGHPTVLVADSENDRVVEYERRDGEWVRTWTVGADSLNWPRDADRLPNGNTLIVDSLNHRVIEVTPQGKIVWEYFATWGPYDVERPVHGQGSNGPTMADRGVTGEYPIRGSAGLLPGTGDRSTFAAAVEATFTGTPLAKPAAAFASTWAHVVPWIRPAWLGSWSFVAAVAGLLVASGWAAVELAIRRRRLAAGLRRLGSALR